MRYYIEAQNTQTGALIFRTCLFDSIHDIQRWMSLVIDSDCEILYAIYDGAVRVGFLQETPEGFIAVNEKEEILE